MSSTPPRVCTCGREAPVPTRPGSTRIAAWIRGLLAVNSNVTQLPGSVSGLPSPLPLRPFAAAASYRLFLHRLDSPPPTTRSACPRCSFLPQHRRACGAAQLAGCVLLQQCLSDKFGFWVSLLQVCRTALLHCCETAHTHLHGLTCLASLFAAASACQPVSFHRSAFCRNQLASNKPRSPASINRKSRSSASCPRPQPW